ncbi:MAG: iron-containing redox enzyme family protein [Gammaproteobacteria bacterium]|nr:iron-containing redox enzyme family protein [Gammaproteobacteria bacterium]
MSKQTETPSAQELPHSPDNISIEDIINKVSFREAYLQVARIFDFTRHPYFAWMKITDKHSFARSQIPFRYAVEGFSCALAATLAKIPELERRVRLAENVAEEHGLVGNKMPHKYTIAGFLNALGIDDSELDIPCPAGVHAFNESIRNYCLTNSAEASAALLGIIEYVFITISNLVATHIVSSGWTTQGSQHHYETHEALDIEHSQVLFDISEDHWQHDCKRGEICQGLILGGHYFWGLYNTLYQNEVTPSPI